MDTRDIVVSLKLCLSQTRQKLAIAQIWQQPSYERAWCLNKVQLVDKATRWSRYGTRAFVCSINKSNLMNLFFFRLVRKTSRLVYEVERMYINCSCTQIQYTNTSRTMTSSLNKVCEKKLRNKPSILQRSKKLPKICVNPSKDSATLIVICLKSV